jgi:hypothetical protein
MKVQARKGYFFPISPATARTATTNWLYYTDSEGKKRPGILQYANPYGRVVGRAPLIELTSPSSILVFSIPERIDPRLGECAALRAIELSATLSANWKPVKGNVARSFIIYLEEGNALSIVERRIHYQRPKYRGSQKFSHAFKPRVVKTEDAELERVKLHRPVLL